MFPLYLEMLIAGGIGLLSAILFWVWSSKNKLEPCLNIAKEIAGVTTILSISVLLIINAFILNDINKVLLKYANILIGAIIFQNLLTIHKAFMIYHNFKNK